MPLINRQLRLKTRPEGLVSRDDFDLVEQAVPDLQDGEVLVRVLYLSMDPTNRVWMRDIPQYLPPVAIGEVMRALGLGRVVQSRSAHYAEGDLVQGVTGWQDYLLLHESAKGYVRLPADPGIPLPTLLGAAGMSGVTAYYGLTDIAPVQAGETLVVSAAAGSVGSIAGQIGRIMGARVVGIAGGADKCRHLVDHLGFDAAVDYKSAEFKQQLKAATPDGIHVNFENVGGEVMRAVLSRMVIGGRVALCGMISGYNSAERPGDDFSPVIMKRLSVRGFLVLDYTRTREAVGAITGWIREGKLKTEETVAEGLENAPVVLNRLFDGIHRGKLVLRVDGQA
ncbi:Putative zinc-binding oxidoreductase [Rhodanobacter sp. Root179]|uniref:NADP-dependent oxidoreductase n=1 Tax=unclassified Rhodanobacter TaxID=2621553 RepID=UPI000701D5F1|nr:MULTISPECIES: NADP-dependent oxidoreductase [unclassified Rhodanobacter]KQZ66728.1 NADP-dependent oxidoreductase [Rhodanobacter sp. Root561]KRB51201.1 NADP-dependent oxidoreductase [Rhodanobacter sp. Root179]